MLDKVRSWVKDKDEKKKAKRDQKASKPTEKARLNKAIADSGMTKDQVNAEPKQKARKSKYTPKQAWKKVNGMRLKANAKILENKTKEDKRRIVQEAVKKVNQIE